MVNPSIQPILAELEQAVEKEFSVEIDYRTGREEQPKNRRIDPNGKSIQIIEAQSLKERLVAIASDLMEYYQL